MKSLIIKAIATIASMTLLVACGGGGGSSTKVETNTAPVANAGASQNVITSTVVTLDGSGSTDANGDNITYSWTFTTKPNGSIAALSSATAVKPTFTADVTGTYVLNLVVNDSKENSAAASVTVNSSQTPKVSIVFDYTYDTNGFFTPERRVIMEKAATVFTSRMKGTTWARVDTAITGGNYDLAFINPSNLAISWNHNVVIPENQVTIYLGAINFTTSPFTPMKSSTGDGATQLLSIKDVSGGISSVLTNLTQFRPINASITFDLQGIQNFSASITRQWHFDSDGNLNTDDRNPSDPHYGDYSDFYTAAVHELGHVLGIHNPQVFSAFLAFDPNFASAYLSHVQSDGVGGFVFNGPHATQLYYNHVGQNIPLDVSTKSHWADGVRSETANGWTSLSYESNQPFRHRFSALEFGALQDIGHTISAY